jgi:prenyltransferase beta subunit
MNPLVDETFAFLHRCRRADGGYAPSPDPDYAGCSDTAASDLAAPVYAAVLARTVGLELPDPDATAEFLRSRQRPDGSFANSAGTFDPDSDLAMLYNTTQAVVGLRALGAKPRFPVHGVMARFFAHDAFHRLPWYTTSFFPLFYAALDAPFPEEYKQALKEHMTAHQAADGYVGDHVAAAFHMTHFFCLIGEPTPRAGPMVERALLEQTPEGGWNIKAPDWDVHACFDAVFILRQLGGGSERCRAAIARAGRWALSCRNADGGFGHYPGWPSDVDAVYFQFGTLWQAGLVGDGTPTLPEGRTLGWGHAL